MKYQVLSRVQCGTVTSYWWAAGFEWVLDAGKATVYEHRQQALNASNAHRVLRPDFVYSVHPVPEPLCSSCIRGYHDWCAVTEEYPGAPQECKWYAKTSRALREELNEQ